MPLDPFPYDNEVASSASYAVAVTPSPDPLDRVTKALYVGTTGNVAVTMRGGGDVTFSNVPAGSYLFIRVSHVLAATTASDIVALS